MCKLTLNVMCVFQIKVNDVRNTSKKCFLNWLVAARIYLQEIFILNQFRNSEKWSALQFSNLTNMDTVSLEMYAINNM